MNRQSDPSAKTEVALDSTGKGLVPVATFGDFELLRLLGEGGMSSVWLARLRRAMGFAKIVALKRMHPQMMGRDDARQLFVDEARLTASLRHPNIVEVYDCGETDGQLWLSMEFVDGWTLAQIVEALSAQGERLPDAVIAELFAQVCSALDHAHNATNEHGDPHHLVHRDIKPENIIVSRNGVAMLMDFGIVLAATNLHRTAEAGTARGTVLYMSPEQVRARPLDHRSDLFALGSTLKFAITGEPPFVAPNIPDIMYAIAHGSRDDALMAVGIASPDFLTTFMRATEQEPDMRFDDASEMRADLLAIRARTDAGETLATWIQRNRERLDAATAAAASPTGTESLLAMFVEDTSEVVVPPVAPVRAASPAPATPVARPVRAPPRRAEVGPTRMQSPRRRHRAAIANNTHARLWLTLVVAVLVVGSMGVALLMRMSSPTETQRVVSVREPTPAPTLAPRAEPMPPRDIVATPTPARVVVAHEPTPAITPARIVTPASTPTPRTATMPVPTGATPDDTPVIAMGSIALGSQPWAYIEIDGQTRGHTPKNSLELPVGPHTVVFRCGSCETEQRIERSVTIHEGINAKIVVSFDP